MAVDFPRACRRPRYQAADWDVNSSLPRLADAELFARPPSKLLGRHYGYSCDDLLARAVPAVAGLVTVTHSSSKGLIEAAELGVSKASVVAELAADHGIARESVIAFGDPPTTCRCSAGRALLRGGQRAPRGARRRDLRHRVQRRRRRRRVPGEAVPQGA